MIADRLTTRQQQVADLLRIACTNKQIAAELGLSEHTVRVHVSMVLAKLGVNRRAQVAAMRDVAA